MTNNYIEKAILIHGNKFDYTKTNYLHHREKIIITCKEHGDFLQRPDIHLSGHGCKKCAISLNKNRIPKNKSNTNEFILKAIKIHKNNFDYTKVNYVNTKTNIIIICKIHGEFLQTPNSHLNGSGCIICKRLINNNKHKLNIEQFINRSREKHGELYDYSKTDYKNSKKCVTITCRKHGDFLQKPESHMLGKGCHICGGSCKSSTKEFIIKANNIHKNNFDYTKVNYVNAKTNIIIICKIHGEFLQTPNAHLSGKGCSQCISNKFSSKQIKWLSFISIYYNINIQHALNGGEFSIKNTRYTADGYCKETNTIYEFHGDFWHGNPKIYKEDDVTYFGKTYKNLYEKTIKKEETIKKLGYNLVVIWENDWNRINRSISFLQRKFINNKNL